MRYVFLLALLSTGFAEGAFRIYKLRLIHYDAFGNFSKKETVLSTLDPFQYEHYYGGYRWTRVEMVNTWYCPGDTSRKRFCDEPKVPQRTPASLERGKRVEIPFNRQPVIP